MSGRGADAPVLDDAEEVGRLHRHGERARVHGGRERRRVGRAVASHGHLDDLEIEVRKVGAHRFAILGMDSLRQDRLGAPPREPLGHQERLGQRGGALVQRRVGDVESRQAGRCASGTRRSTGACPARPRADTAYRRSATRRGRASDPRAPRRSGCRAPAPRKNADSRAFAFFFARPPRSRRISISERGGGRFGLARTAAGIDANRSSIDRTPIAASISARSESDVGRNFTFPSLRCGRTRRTRPPTSGSRSPRRKRASA